jgi:hypothetical protein
MTHIHLPALPKRIFCAATIAILAGHAVPSSAAGDHLPFAQAPSGVISTLLVGSADPCNGAVIFPMGTPSVAQNGNEFDITSPFVIANPPGCPSPPQPYEVTAALATVPEGQNVVVWTVDGFDVRASFNVVGTVLQAPLRRDDRY